MGFFSVVCLLCLCVCLFVPCSRRLGKGCSLLSSLWCINVSVSLSGWCHGSGVVLDCIVFDICTLAFFSRFTDVSSLLFSIFLPNDVGSGNLWLMHLTDIHAFFISLFHPNVVGSGNM